ncbi:MAG: hypothetical protein M1371_05240 [Actinobacteria bacterium]|nr:hypothetical protein [Actinomycetota bacterium]
MENKKLLLLFVKAESEEDVLRIIESNPILKQDKNWKPYGGFRGNFSQIHNQQGNAIPALVEKPINSIDAILIKECKLKGIDPEDNKAPSSIQKAVEMFFGIKGGDFSEITENNRRKIAKSVQIIAEGSRQNPNIIIYDNGEGQHPNDFENTFVSLNRDNKLKIKFVQGQYNMGGTGALPNCGRNKYQLILSRKHPRLLNGEKDLYGFTLVRLHLVHSIGEYKTSWYEFCVDENGEVFSFPADEDLDLGLFEIDFNSGTYIKLFNYDLPDLSDITLGLWRDFNRYLYFPALPILLFEKRDYKGHSRTKLMLGNKIRIMIDSRDMKETTFPMTINFKNMKFPAEVTILKDYVDKKEFIDTMAVVFTINGQVHDFQKNSFITTNAKLPYLSGYLLVNVDCTNIPTDIKSELFMASRDRMRNNNIARMLLEEIANELKDNNILRQINEKRRDEKIFQNPKDEEFLKKVMSKLLNKNEEISKILGLNGNIASNVTKTIIKNIIKEGEKFKSKRFPTFMQFKRIAPGNIKMIPQNGESKLFLETDVEDEYLIRPRDKGELKITFEKPHLGIGGDGDIIGSDEEIFDVNIVGPNQGHIKLRVKTKEELPIGAIVKMSVELSSPDGPLVLTAFIKIADPVSPAQEKEVETPKTYSLPKTILVYKERKQGIESATWDDSDYNWTGEDICKIFPSSNDRFFVDAVAINMDADSVHNYVRSKKLTDKNIEHLKRLFQVSIYLISLILYFQVSHRDEIEDKEEILSFLMKGIGKIIIPVIVNEELIREIENE